jgi:predicted Zn-dependent protease
MDHFDQALQFLASGQLDEARIYLEELLRQGPENTDLLYNQGPLLCGPRPARSGARAPAPLPPARSRPLARLRGPGARLPTCGRPAAGQGVHHCLALAVDPKNPVALKNLGAILSKEKGSLRALYYLRRSNECDPQDPQTVHCLAFAA